MRKSKNRNFYHIFVFPGDAPGAIMLNVGTEQLEWRGYPMVKISNKDIFIRFDVIHERDRQTDTG